MPITAHRTTRHTKFTVALALAAGILTSGSEIPSSADTYPGPQAGSVSTSAHDGNECGTNRRGVSDTKASPGGAVTWEGNAASTWDRFGGSFTSAAKVNFSRTEYAFEASGSVSASASLPMGSTTCSASSQGYATFSMGVRPRDYSLEWIHYVATGSVTFSSSAYKEQFDGEMGNACVSMAVSDARYGSDGDSACGTGTIPINFDRVAPAGHFTVDISTLAVLRRSPDVARSASATANFNVTVVGTPVTAPNNFDWKMPDRFGRDSDGDGLIDYFAPDGTLEMSPEDWRVDFTDGGDGTPCDTTLERTWTIDGIQVDGSDPRALVLDPNACEFSYEFPAEGTYQVVLEIRGRDEEDQGYVVSTIGHDVVVQDWLIVSLGDSVASGEGNPDIPGSSPRWQNQQCHRSASAGPALAALNLERSDPRTSVTFVHLACSGATVDEGVLGQYLGQEPGAPIPPQVVQMHELTEGREIDAVTLSVGANDVKFSTIVEKCYIFIDCHAPTTGTAREFFELMIPGLPGRYDSVAATLSGPVLQIPPDRVYLTEYFDPTRDETTDFCDHKILEEANDAPIVGISRDEAEWASTDMLRRLNQEGANAGARHGWRYVAGPYASFAAHGYCSSARWIVQLTESFADQGNKDGTLHPNEPGHANYAAHVGGSLFTDFYPGGDLRSPRAPATQEE